MSCRQSQPVPCCQLSPACVGQPCLGTEQPRPRGQGLLMKCSCRAPAPLMDWECPSCKGTCGTAGVRCLDRQAGSERSWVGLRKGDFPKFLFCWTFPPFPTSSLGAALTLPIPTALQCSPSLRASSSSSSPAPSQPQSILVLLLPSSPLPALEHPPPLLQPLPSLRASSSFSSSPPAPSQPQTILLLLLLSSPL